MKQPVVNIIGSGIAGLSVALRLRHARVRVITSGTAGRDGASWLAKGGIAAAIGPEDHPDYHFQDTLKAGDGLCQPEMVQHITNSAAENIDWLISQGVLFDHDDQGLKLGLEGAHSHHRIIHANGDHTGRAIMAALVLRAKEASHIEWVEYATGVHLERNAFGVQGLWINTAEDELEFLDGQVVLACGGSGQLYLKTTNPSSAWGSGLYLAAQAGAKLRDLEFVQFHPTALDVDNTSSLPLMTEALRGAGAILVDRDGTPIMQNDHPLRDLAPRHIVSQAIWKHRQSGHPVFLDATGIGEFSLRFPAAAAACGQHGIDPVSQLIPVTPAAHYHMGGVVVDSSGQTTVNGLYACGEVASTGLHGANRLASNSLLEGLVCGQDVAHAIEQRHYATDPFCTSPKPPSLHQEHDPAVISQIRQQMWRSAGLLRNHADLQQALKTVDRLSRDPGSFQSHVMLWLANAICKAALNRTESVGAHWRDDSLQAACSLEAL